MLDEGMPVRQFLDEWSYNDGYNYIVITDLM
jgi:hypothetical protein